VSRVHKATFFEIKQMTLLCAPCHTLKTFNRCGMPILVLEIVRRREGGDFIMDVIARSKRVKKWSLDELQKMTEEFEGMYR
jgi:hypothetical protein